MSLSIVHAFHSGKTDGPDPTLVQPSNWNAAHTLSMDSGFVLGRQTAGTGVVEELTSAQIQAFINLDTTGTLGTSDTHIPSQKAAKTYVDAQVSAEATARAAATPPSGAIQMFAMQTAPAGWLEADGSAISRTTYAALFAAIGVVYGVGDGSTTFNLPDFRGQFLRGWDHGKGVDSGRTFGSSQSSANLSHTHTGVTGDESNTHTHGVNVYNSNVGAGGDPISSNNNSGFHSSTTSTENTGHTHSFTTAATGGSEARPVNFAVLICLKT